MPTNMWEYPDGRRKKEYGQGSKWRLSAPNPDGTKTITRMFSGNAEAARKAEAKWRMEIEEGRGVDPKLSKTTIAAYSVIFCASRTWRDGSRRRMDLDFRNYIIPFVGHLTLRGARKIHMEEWAVSLAATGLSARTRRHAMAALYGMFESARQSDYMTGSNPLDGVPRPTIKDAEYWLPAPTMLQALITALPERYRLIAAIAAGCGLRFGEVMGLTTRDVVEEITSPGQVIFRIYVRHQLSNVGGGEAAHLAETKTEASLRTVAVPPAVAAMLRTHLAHPEWMTTLDIEDRSGDKVRGEWPVREVTLLFANLRGRPMSKNSWGPTWRAARAAVAGMDAGFGLHGLRHLFITTLILAGHSGPAVQARAGHKDLETTMGTYAHYFRLMDAKADDTSAVDVLFTPPVIAAA